MGRGAEVGVMELHRSEMVSGKGGVLIPLSVFGMSPHTGSLRNDILNLKFHNNRAVAKELAEQVSQCLVHMNATVGMHFMTWAPTTVVRKSERGYDQAEVLARHLGVFVSIPVKGVLRRVNKQSQTGLHRMERLVQPQFVAKPVVAGKKIIVVDDVTTTGATFRAAAQALAIAGCVEVLCVAPSWKP